MRDVLQSALYTSELFARVQLYWACCTPPALHLSHVTLISHTVKGSPLEGQHEPSRNSPKVYISVDYSLHCMFASDGGTVKFFLRCFEILQTLLSFLFPGHSYQHGRSQE